MKNRKTQLTIVLLSTLARTQNYIPIFTDGSGDLGKPPEVSRRISLWRRDFLSVAVHHGEP